MIPSKEHARGGATVGVLNALDAWESCVVLNLRLWCDSAEGQAQVRNAYRVSLPAECATRECCAFETLVMTVTAYAQRPLVRHDVSCVCMGADEGVFLHLIRTASEGHLNDAALIATLLVGPAQAERVALMAGQVGACARKIHARSEEHFEKVPQNVVRLH